MGHKAKTFYELIEKFNPYHDRLGRFASGGGFMNSNYTGDRSRQAVTFSANPNTRAGAMAIQRESANSHESIGRAYDNPQVPPKTTTATPSQANSKQPEKEQKETETARTKALHEVEDRIRNQNYESAAVIDKDGNQVLFKDGKSNYVSFSPLECMEMTGNTLTHNHPRCSMFSKEDLQCMVSNGMYEVRATNRDGTTYSMRRADKGYSKDKAWEFSKAYDKEYFKAIAHAQSDLDSRGFQKKILNGEVTQKEANIEFGRSSAKYMANYAKKEAPKYGLVFTVEQRNVSTKKSLRGTNIMKTDEVKENGFMLDKDTNALEDKAFKEWLEKAQNSKPDKTAKSFNDILRKDV